MARKKIPETATVNGKPFICPVCGNNMFTSRRAQLNTAVASFFDVDWANKSATCFICTECTHISWFLGQK